VATVIDEPSHPALDCLDEPVFILCAARTGSTLLRYFLDSHPDIGCPPETNLSAVFDTLNFTLDVLISDDDEVVDSTIKWSRQFAAATIGRWTAKQGKLRWCDKSLPSAMNPDYLLKAFPDASFLNLFRECADFIVSAIEASPWGFSGYGFDPYIRQSPDNFVRGLGLYWAERTEQQLRFEADHPDHNLRIRYEDLVLDSVGTLKGVADFLGLKPCKEFETPELCLQVNHQLGPGDHKILHSRMIASDSIGQGWRVPRELLPPPLAQRIDASLKELGYRSLYEGTEDLDGTARPSSQHGQHLWDEELMEKSLLNCLRSFDPSQHVEVLPLAVRVLDHSRTWKLEVGAETLPPADGDERYSLLLARETLRSLIDGSGNFGVMARQGFLRLAKPDGIADRELQRAMIAIAELLHSRSFR